MSIHEHPADHSSWPSLTGRAASAHEVIEALLYPYNETDESGNFVVGKLILAAEEGSQGFVDESEMECVRLWFERLKSRIAMLQLLLDEQLEIIGIRNYRLDFRAIAAAPKPDRFQHGGPMTRETAERLCGTCLTELVTPYIVKAIESSHDGKVPSDVRGCAALWFMKVYRDLLMFSRIMDEEAVIQGFDSSKQPIFEVRNWDL